MVLAAGLFRIDRLSFWLDEATSYVAANRDWTQPWTAIHLEGSIYMSLYFAVLSVWEWFGQSIAWLRGLSVVSAVLVIPATAWTAHQLFGRKTAAMAVLLLPLNTFFIQYAQEARSYTLLVLLTMTATGLWLTTRRDNRARWYIAYVAVAGLSIYAHLFAAFVIGAHGLISLITWRPLRPQLAKLVITYCVIGLIWSPLLLLVAGSGAGGLDWIQPPSLPLLAEYVSRLAGFGWILGCISTLGLVIVILEGIRAERRSSGRGEAALTVAGLTLVPILGSFLLSQWRPMFVDRYLIVALIPMTICVARMIVLLLPVGGLVALVVVGISAMNLTAYYNGPPREDWRAATNYLLNSFKPGDGVAFSAGYTRQVFEYYIEHTTSIPTGVDPLYPSASWGDYVFGETPVGTPSSIGDRDSLAHRRIWLVMSHATPEIETVTINALRQRPVVEERSFAGGIDVRLYEEVGATDANIRGPAKGYPGEFLRYSIQTGDILPAALSNAAEPLSVRFHSSGGAMIELPAGVRVAAGKTTATVRLPDTDGGYEAEFVLKLGPAWERVIGREAIEVLPNKKAWTERLQATYQVESPTQWRAGKSRSYAVAVTNTGDYTWNAGGVKTVDLSISFGDEAEGPGNSWASEQRFHLPRDVGPGQTVLIPVEVRPPQAAGNYIMRYWLVKEDVAWFPDQATTYAVVSPNNEFVFPAIVIMLLALVSLIGLARRMARNRIVRDHPIAR
jgi:mannosyltransferase